MYMVLCLHVALCTKCVQDSETDVPGPKLQMIMSCHVGVQHGDPGRAVGVLNPEPSLWSVWFFETGSHLVQADFEFLILLSLSVSLSLKCWD